jgi:hypothetical protein
MMNLEDLMAVWRSQDAAPLLGVDRTLLHLALRQDEVKQQNARRRERWMIYVVGTGVVGAIAVFLGMMILADEREVLTGWDFAVAIIGAAAALFAGCALYVGHRAQSRREDRFGESLREQLNRRIAQLDYAETRAPRTSMLVLVILGLIAPMALTFLSLRTNQKTLSDNWLPVVNLLLICVGSIAFGVWQVRRQIRDVVLPRKRTLEGLLKEIEGQ